MLTERLTMRHTFIWGFVQRPVQRRSESGESFHRPAVSPSNGKRTCPALTLTGMSLKMATPS